MLNESRKKNLKAFLENEFEEVGLSRFFPDMCTGVLFGLWTTLNLFEQVLTNLDKYELSWTSLNPFEQILKIFFPF